MTGAQTNASRIRELNATIRYAMWSVFRAAGRLGPGPREEVTAEVEALLEQVAGKDVVVRGTYDVSALRADADVMVWWHAPSADAQCWPRTDTRPLCRNERKFRRHAIVSPLRAGEDGRDVHQRR